MDQYLGKDAKDEAKVFYKMCACCGVDQPFWGFTPFYFYFYFPEKLKKEIINPALPPSPPFPSLSSPSLLGGHLWRSLFHAANLDDRIKNPDQ